MGDLVTQRRWRYTLTVDNVSFGVWDSKSGGKLELEEQKYARGDMGEEEAHTGKASRENITLERGYDDLRDPLAEQQLEALRGRKAVVTRQLLAANRTPLGDPRTYTGRLKSVAGPDHDSNSNEVGKLIVEIATDADAA